MGSRDWTQVIRQQAPVPLSHLGDPIESSLTNTTVLVIFLIAVTQYLQEQLEGTWVEGPVHRRGEGELMGVSSAWSQLICS